MNKTHAALLNKLGFSTLHQASGRQSVADIFRPGRRCGIYLLGFENGEWYVGQAVDVVRRFAQHRITHGDIALVAFAECSRNQLNDTERRCIHALEAGGVRLRNIAQMSVVQGERDLDLVISPQQQQDWLQDPEALSDTTRHVQDDALRSRLLPRLQALQKLEQAEEALYILGLYLDTAIPAPRKTELTFWMVSCLPYGLKEPALLYRLSLNMQETLSVFLEDGALWASFHLASSPFEQALGTDWRGILQAEGFQTRPHAYNPGGHDQFQLVAFGVPDIVDVICHGVSGGAMALLNLRLMRKGPTFYGTSHNLALVDAAFETYRRLEAE